MARVLPWLIDYDSSFLLFAFACIICHSFIFSLSELLCFSHLSCIENRHIYFYEVVCFIGKSFWKYELISFIFIDMKNVPDRSLHRAAQDMASNFPKWVMRGREREKERERKGKRERDADQIEAEVFL